MRWDLCRCPAWAFSACLLIGLIAGYVAERAMNRDHGLLTNMLVGIAGSFVGGALAGVLNINYYGFAGNLVVAIVGAILILWALRPLRSAADRQSQTTKGPIAMVTILDATKPDAPKPEAKRVRHPEKQKRPDTEVKRKPEWIRVKAPTSKGYQETRSIVKANNSSPSARRPAAPISANAGTRSTPPS
jgi:uncharacterized membrane protein YeaQ/YmgE (transglycosylase-associated protein family)